MGNQWEYLEELRQFLCWQKLCGADAWLVERSEVWNPDRFRRSTQRPLSRGNASRSQPKESPSYNSTVVQRKPPQETARVQQKPSENLTGAWGQMLEKRPPKIDPTILDEKTGMKRIKAHQEKYCSVQGACSLGGGRPNNPVLILEGHADRLSEQGRTTLSIIRSQVLQLGQNQIYWLPYPINPGCGLCTNLFSSALECISPKVVLVMGEALRHRISMIAAENSRTQQIEIGEEIQLVSNKWTIPGIWTFHPNDLSVAPQEMKQESMRHFTQFRRLLRQKGI